MAIKFKAKSKEEIPSELQSLYVEREGGFVLNVEGAVEKSKVEEVRSTNAALLKERDELRKRFDGIDPDEARKLFEKQALQAGEIEKVIEGRVRVLKGYLEKQYAGVAAERDGLNARLKSLRSLCSPRLCVYLFASIFLPFTSSLPSFPSVQFLIRVHPWLAFATRSQTFLNYFSICPSTDTFCPPIQVKTEI